MRFSFAISPMFFGLDMASDILFPNVRARAEEETIPVLFGVAAVAAPYVAGAALVALAPNPFLKAVGVSMLIPSPTDIGVFYVGYKVGESFQHEIAPWVA